MNDAPIELGASVRLEFECCAPVAITRSVVRCAQRSACFSRFSSGGLQGRRSGRTTETHQVDARREGHSESGDRLRRAGAPSRAPQRRSTSAVVARWISLTSYLKKWMVLGVAIGAVASCGGRRLLRGTQALHPPLLGRPRRLAGAHPFRRGQPRRLGVSGTLVVAPPRGLRERTDRRHPHVLDRPRYRRPRDRRVHLGRPSQSPRRAVPDRGGQDHRLGAHHLRLSRPTGRISAGFGSLLARASILNRPTPEWR